MSNVIFGRKIELILGRREFSSDDFTIFFDIPFDDEPDDNKSKITIYNLSNDTLAEIGATPNVIINAGYGDDVGAVLLGFADTLSTEWDNGVDKVTTVQASDGAGQYYKQRIQKTYAKGTKASFIIDDVCRMTGIKLGDMDFKRDYVYTRGKAIKGGVIDIFKIIAKDCGSRVYSRNGQIFFRVPGKGKVIGFVLDSDHGLIGSPAPIYKEVTEGETKKKITGYKVQMLLNHRITTDSVIEIKSKTANGVFRVYNGSHKATASDFITEVEVYA